MKTFEDLEFVKRETCSFDTRHASQARYTFDNGYEVSVLFGTPFYSDGIDTYEVAILKDGDLCYDTHITDDVLGYRTKEEVTEIMKQVQELPKIEE